MKKIIGAALIVLSLAGCAGSSASGDSRTADRQQETPGGATSSSPYPFAACEARPASAARRRGAVIVGG